MISENPGSGARAVPSVNLPKGGGAVRGMGEKFAANPATGTGSLTVPIPTSPGRAGFGPELSLSYDSGSGNGPFGIGFSLELPAITRKTEKGVPQYLDESESDVFILSGYEDLVPVLDQDGSRFEDRISAPGYIIHRYRPRIEGLFARIERWTRIDGDVHWRSISRENILTVYGFHGDSRIADPADASRVFSWLICQSYDDKGNAILYDYAAENAEGVDTVKPSERNRVRTANRYIKRISYGNRTPLLFDPERPSFRPPHTEQPDFTAADWMFEVVFDYGENHYLEDPPDGEGRIFARADTAPGKDWEVRRDPFSSYRSAFEIRSYRLCRRVLMFHHFPVELGIPSCLVRSTALEYTEKPIGSFITRVIQSGHKLRQNNRYLTRSLPPLDLSFIQSPLEDPDFTDFRLETVDQASQENLPGGIDGDRYLWLDLDGEGISGVLTEQEGAWYYKPNLGDGALGPMQAVASLPSVAAMKQKSRLFLDVAGDGNLDLVDLSPHLAGYQERSAAEGWEEFRTFQALPLLDYSDPNLRFADLTGDGVADLLLAGEDSFTWHPSLFGGGFGEGRAVRLPSDEEQGARVVFADAEQAVYLADMSGDGLSDILRIRDGEICYWPNLGYGRFGAKVTMENAPRFDGPDQFDQGRIRLADSDGSGTTDIFYLGREGVDVFLNQTGNGWSDRRRLNILPVVDNVASVMVTDFLGRGTACLVWSSPLPGDAGRALRYVDLMCGQKPHLLSATVNNLGTESRIEYASSTEFYLADKAAGTPWVTRLPFPVQVVKRVESYDYVGRNRFVSSYSYHHGFYDGVEREFRGFGRIDQYDTEEIAALTESGAFPTGDNIDAASNVPPVLTRSWFHTGAFIDAERISRHLAHEYYREGSGPGEAPLSPEQVAAMLLDDTVLPGGLTAGEAREACRSLKGALLRQELYALDGSEAASRPYTVTESNYTIKTLQNRGGNRYAVFFSHGRETLTFDYERKLYEVGGERRADPRVSHQVILEADEFGNLLTGAAIGYGRRFADPSPWFGADDRDKQSRILVSVTESSYTNAVQKEDAYRTPLGASSRLYQVVQGRPAANLPQITNLFRFEEVAAMLAQAGDGGHDLPPEDWEGKGVTGPAPYRRLLREERTLYRSNALDALLPAGSLESLAVMGESYKLALTPALLQEVYGPLLPDPAAVLGSRAPDGGGYLDLDGDGRWWIPNGRVFLHPDPQAGPAQERAEAYQHFFLPRRLQDAFGHGSRLDYDPHRLMTVRVLDAAGNEVQVETDYRVLQTRQMTDPNGNRIEAVFDTLGMVAATAVKGKEGESLGDLLEDVDPDPPRSALQAFASDPLGEAASLLGKATSRIVYDLDRFRLSGNPALAASLARESHFFDSGTSPLKVQVTLSYSDGSGREIQRKLQAEPGPLQEGGGVVAPRWVGSGWTVFNNKGNPVRRYEPFFDDSHDFRFGMAQGVSPVFCYDPVGRLVATLHPDHSYEKVLFDPWGEQRFDRNDTVTFDPRSDADVAPFFSRLPEADYLPTWYALRTDPALASQAQARWPDPLDRQAEKEAALKAAKHADTPALAHFDVMGRAFLSVAQNRFERRKPDDTVETVEERYGTRVVFDLEGNQRAVLDAKGRVVARHDFDLLGNRLHEASMEAGERWTLDDAMAQPIRAWDSKGRAFRTEYDPLRRHTRSFLREGAAPEALVEHTVYGEELQDPEPNNLRGRVAQLFDQAGVVFSDAFDFKGNLVSSRRRHASNYRDTLDWGWSVALEEEAYASHTRYDALNRIVELTTPHTPGMQPSLIRPTYNEANLLERLEANLNGAAGATRFIEGIDYDARGQRTLIEYGNGVRSSRRYDPFTLRLSQLVTRREGAAFPEDCPQPPPAGWPGCQVQNLHYSFDPSGNITGIRDDAQQAVFFRNRRVDPSAEYSYDAIYRLIEASGREHLGQAGGPLPSSYNDRQRVGVLFSASDGQAMGRYRQRFLYDEVGNLTSVAHRGSDPAQAGWSRDYAYQEGSLLEPGKTSNRLSSTTLHPNGSQPLVEPYSYDAHGNMLRMPHLQEMDSDFNDQLKMTRRQAVNAEDEDGVQHQGERTFYVYNSAGQRVRKVTELSSGEMKEERIYLNGFEIHRRLGPNPVVRETLHIMDDEQRIALVETRTGGSDPGPARLVRYQFGNHLGSAALELDDQGQVISYEEYYPHGGTAFQAVRSQTETPKRYRWAGMERDDESGLNCHGLRYYAPWLGRWTSGDPSGLNGGVNLYSYAANSPVVFLDTAGQKPKGGVTFPIDPRYQKKWGPTQTLPLPGPKPKKATGGEGGGRKKQGSQAGSQSGAEGGAKGGVEGGEEGGIVGGKVGGMGEDVRTGGPPGTGATPSQAPAGGEGPGSGTDPGTDPNKPEEGGGTGAEKGKGKGKAPGAKEGGVTGGSPGGKPGGKAGGKAGGAQDGPPDSKPGNKGDDSLLGDLAALASLITDPESLYHAKKNGNSGKGAQIGRKNGLISGWLGQILVIGMVFMGRIKDMVKGIGNFFKAGYNKIRNKLFGKVEQKALEEGLDQGGLLKLFGQGADDAEAVLDRLVAGEVVDIPKNVTPKMLREYRAAAEANIAEIKSGNIYLINPDDAIATQSMRIQIIDILLGRMGK